jgi:hypothetical protein
MKIAIQLRKRGFNVIPLSPFHFRVNGEFDFFENCHGNLIAWHDRFSGDRGRATESDILKIASERLRPRSAKCLEEDFVRRLTDIGWTEAAAKEAWQERSRG